MTQTYEFADHFERPWPIDRRSHRSQLLFARSIRFTAPDDRRR